MEFRTCPLPMVGPWERSMVNLYADYTAGRYPLTGGLIVNPLLYGDAMREIDRALSAFQRVEDERRGKR